MLQLIIGFWAYLGNFASGFSVKILQTDWLTYWLICALGLKNKSPHDDFYPSVSQATSNRNTNRFSSLCDEKIPSSLIIFFFPDRESFAEAQEAKQWWWQTLSGFNHTQSKALTRSKRADGDAWGVCPNRGKILGLICLPLLLQCYDQPNELYRELGLSFCCITHTLAQHRKPTVDTSTQMDGWVCWCSRQQSITQSHFSCVHANTLECWEYFW